MGKNDSKKIESLTNFWDQEPLIPTLEAKIAFFNGQKNPAMSKEFCITSVLPLKVLCEQVILNERAKKEDFQFIKSIFKSDETPDYNGYNKQECVATQNTTEHYEMHCNFAFIH